LPAREVVNVAAFVWAARSANVDRLYWKLYALEELAARDPASAAKLTPQAMKDAEAGLDVLEELAAFTDDELARDVEAQRAKLKRARKLLDDERAAAKAAKDGSRG
jgi:hypothetical protein